MMMMMMMMMTMMIERESKAVTFVRGSRNRCVASLSHIISS